MYKSCKILKKLQIKNVPIPKPVEFFKNLGLVKEYKLNAIFLGDLKKFIPMRNLTNSPCSISDID